MSPAELKAARRRLGLSSAELARALGYEGKDPGRQVRRMEAAEGLSSHRPVPTRTALVIEALLRERNM